ncbi:MAG: ATP-binding cassette domain-containing protein, partial [Thermoanaerobaculia bacterium]
MRDLLSIENLSVAFEVGGRRVPVLRRVSLQIDEGDSVGLVGESGSGKSVMALSVLRLLPRA